MAYAIKSYGKMRRSIYLVPCFGNIFIYMQNWLFYVTSHFLILFIKWLGGSSNSESSYFALLHCNYLFVNEQNLVIATAIEEQSKWDLKFESYSATRQKNREKYSYKYQRECQLIILEWLERKAKLGQTSSWPMQSDPVKSHGYLAQDR